MGYNTTLVLLNDALPEIARDKDLGAQIADAVRTFDFRRNSKFRQDAENPKTLSIPAGNHCNALAVVSSNHADFTALVATGGNTGRLVDLEFDGGRGVLNPPIEFAKRILRRHAGEITAHERMEILKILDPSAGSD